jgi:hypothetical protein
VEAPDALKILITNLKLTARSGTEMYVRDLGLELRRRGHTPIVYTPIASGTIVDELRRATIPVVDQLDRIGVEPDVIHGHHAHQVMAALLHFDQTPAIFVCHDYAAWHDEPPLFPRIRRYVAVDHTCLDRLVCQSGVDQASAEVMLNFVDLQRFTPRAPLPARPARALVFSHLAAGDGFFGEIAAACRDRGIAVDAAGTDSGRLVQDPETMLGAYDLVFAKGKAALEALAVGAAVVLCDQMGLGPMVTVARLDELQAGNFGRRHLLQPVTRQAAGDEIDRYDAADAAAVSRTLRTRAGLVERVDELVALYRCVIQEQKAAPPDAEAERRATAAYMARIAATEAVIDSENNRRQNVALRSTLLRLEREIEQLRRSAALGKGTAAGSWALWTSRGRRRRID